jgi:hypothetical protein
MPCDVTGSSSLARVLHSRMLDVRRCQTLRVRGEHGALKVIRLFAPYRLDRRVPRNRSLRATAAELANAPDERGGGVVAGLKVMTEAADRRRSTMV